MPPAFLLLVLGLGLVGVAERARAGGPFRARSRAGGGQRPHSLPSYHGWYVALVGGRAGAALPRRVEQRRAGAGDRAACWPTPPPPACPPSACSAARSWPKCAALADGQRRRGVQPAGERAGCPPIARRSRHYAIDRPSPTLLLAFAGGAWAFIRLQPDFRARTRVERVVMARAARPPRWSRS